MREINSNYNEVPMWKKFLLTVKEASLYFNIGENKMHRMVNDYLDSCKTKRCITLKGGYRPC